MLRTVVILAFLCASFAFRALVVEDDGTPVDGAVCSIFGDDLEIVISTPSGACNFTEEVLDGDIITVRDFTPADEVDLQMEYNTSNAPHPPIVLKIYNADVDLIVPFFQEPAAGEIIVFFTWISETQYDLNGWVYDYDLYMFLPDEFDCPLIYWGNEVCHGQNATFCNGRAEMVVDDGRQGPGQPDLTTEWMGLEVMRIKDINPGVYKFAATGGYMRDLARRPYIHEADVLYLGMVFGGRISFGSKTQAAAAFLPQAFLVATPDTAPGGQNWGWWHAFTIEVFEPTETTVKCRRTVDTWKVNHFCNECAPETVADIATTPIVLNTTKTEGELIKSNKWADCIWAITESGCNSYTPPTYNHSGGAQVWGDPHFKTNDNIFFDIFEHGTYNYLNSGDNRCYIQARLVHLWPNNLTYNGQILIEIEDDKFEFSLGTDGALVASKNGDTSFLGTTGEHVFGDISQHRVEIKVEKNNDWVYYFFVYKQIGSKMKIALKINLATMLLPSGNKRDFDFRGVQTYRSFLGLTSGALGDFNHDPGDDFMYGGLNFSMKNNAGSMHLWARKWLLPDPSEKKLLEVGEPTDRFSDFMDQLYLNNPAFFGAPPPGPPLPPAVLQAAKNACAILYPDQITRKFEYDSCVVDANFVGGDQFVLNNPTYATCTDNCNNQGSCQPGDTCDCSQSFTGQWCQTAVCNCLNGATCTESASCICTTGWAGRYCEREPDCSNIENCHVSEGGGICVHDGVCKCNDGFSGPHCGNQQLVEPFCEIMFDPRTNSMDCYGFCDPTHDHVCTTLPDDRYACYCTANLTVTDLGHCNNDTDCNANNIELVKCQSRHCFCKNPGNICVHHDCSACVGCIPGSIDCTGDPDLHECVSNKCRCLYGGACHGIDCSSCKNKIDVTMRPAGSTAGGGTWRVSSTPWLDQNPILLQTTEFDVTVQQPASTLSSDLAQALADALNADPDFNSSCTSVYTGTDWVVQCTSLDSAVLLQFNGSDPQYLANADLNGVSFAEAGHCTTVDDCNGSLPELIGCMFNACACKYGGSCNHTDCSPCQGCVPGERNCTGVAGRFSCSNNQCVCDFGGTCDNLNCTSCQAAGSGAGDPIIYGFDGGWFHFMGEHDKVFNLISDGHLQLNSRFIRDEYWKELTWMGDLGIRVGSDKFLFYLNGTKILNGNPLPPSIIRLDDGGKVTMWEEAIAFEIPNYELYLKILPKPPHFNVHADYTPGPGSYPHGVLGQTSDGVQRFQEPDGPEALKEYINNGVRICTGLNGAGCIDGQSKDYEVMSDDLLGMDFLFNRFLAKRVEFVADYNTVYDHTQPHVFDSQPGVQLDGDEIVGGSGESE